MFTEHIVPGALHICYLILTISGVLLFTLNYDEIRTLTCKKFAQGHPDVVGIDLGFKPLYLYTPNS